jgi:hypothetical protein
VRHRTVGQVLQALNDRLPGTRNTHEGPSHPDRNAPFASINARVQDFQPRGQPVVSGATQKTALVGDLANGGRESHPQGAPERIRVHDFVDKRLGHALPSGVDDRTQHCGWVSVGVDHDPAAFALATGLQCGQRMGCRMSPTAQPILLTADGGGSNGRRSRRWKVEWQKVSDTTSLEVSVCHFPPGTSQWHKIAHRLLCHIPQHGRGRPLVSHEVIVNLIANTTTEAGLRVEAVLDLCPYQPGQKVSDAELAQVN